MRTILIVLLLQAFNLQAQTDSLVLLTKNFKFEDGLYLSFDDFKNNQPKISWDTLNARLYTNPTKLVTTIDFVADDDTVLNDSIWGFSLGGIPYVKYDKENKEASDTYVGLKVRGNICYFSLAEVEEKVELIKAYNPRTGVPFREGEVITKHEVENNYMLSFETGEIEEFDTETFLEWISSDKKLVKTVQGISKEDAEKKLFKCLLIYDDRNPVYVPFRE